MPLTLRYLRLKFPDRFHRQDWYLGEAFMDLALPPDFPLLDPGRMRFHSQPVVTHARNLPLAVELAHLYLAYPGAEIWAHYLWCRDTDHKGQRVYVGGVCPENDMRMEIHRHLQVTNQWGVVAWV